MKFSSIIALAALFVAGSATVSANHVERAHQLKARVHKENGIEKRGQGKMTWYAGGMLNAPACGGDAPSDDDFIVAVAENGGYGSCNQKVRLHYQGQTVEATIRDFCDGCGFGHFDSTKGLFSKFAGLDEGVLTGVDYQLL